MVEFTDIRSIHKPNVIGLLGEDGSGKSTIGKLLEEEMLHCPQVRSVDRDAFATDLKRMVQELDPIVGARTIGTLAAPIYLSELTREGYTEADIKATYPEYRRVLRTLGTKCIRSRDRGFWASRLVRRRIEGRIRRDVLIVDDVRFENESYALRFASRPSAGAVIKVVGRGAGRGDGEQIDAAAYDAIIDNSGTLEETRAQVQEVLAHWGWKH